MIELARHLMEDGSHAALPFHPACPACREERLAGRLTPAPLVSARTRAGLAAAVLAASATAPATALATTTAPEVEGEEETEGSADPGAQGPAGIELPPAVGVTPVTPTIEEPGSQAVAQDDDGALETETPADPDPDPAEPAKPVGAEELQAVPEAPAVPETPAVPEAPAAAAPPAAETPSAGKAEGKPGERGAAKTRRAPAPAPAPAAPALGGVQEAAVPVPAIQPVAAPAAPAAPTQDAEFHVVQSGESLWSIARDRLGPGATTAEIARGVQRIWDLNADAIGTGDPDLLIAGQKLRLR